MAETGMDGVSDADGARMRVVELPALVSGVCGSDVFLLVP